MTTAVQTRSAAPERGPGSRRRGGSLAGTWVLVRFILRRDRIKLPAWLLILTALVFYYAAALPQVIGEDPQAFGFFLEGPVGALLGGPGYVTDPLTIEQVIVGVYGQYFLIAAGLMSILLVVRHTRADEQTGRGELVRASVVGRHAPLTATLIVAVLANVLLALLIGGAMAASFDGSGGLLFGAGVGAVGLVFAGVAALTVQVTEYSRAASGMAGAVLGAAYVIRAAGDLLAGADHGSLLSWFSPLAWSQQTRAYVDGRWWPLALSLALAGVAAAIGYALSSRRDLGAGLVAVRKGAAGAAGWLRTPLAFAFRLQRSALLWWAAALVLGGVLFGGITEAMVEAYGQIDSDELLAVLGGSRELLLDGYLSVMAVVNMLLIAVFAIVGLQTLRSEETRGRAEPVLATAVSRWRWYGSYLAVLVGGAVGLLAVTGAAMGVATAIALRDAGVVWQLVLAHLAHAPALLVLFGIAALLFGVAPRLIGLTWVAYAYTAFWAFFGPLIGPAQWVYNISPLEHIGRGPLEELAWPPVLILGAIAAGLVAIGLAAFRRRDVDSK